MPEMIEQAVSLDAVERSWVGLAVGEDDANALACFLPFERHCPYFGLALCPYDSPALCLPEINKQADGYDPSA